MTECQSCGRDLDRIRDEHPLVCDTCARLDRDDDIVLRLIEVSEELDELANEIGDSSVERNLASNICVKMSRTVLDLAHELEDVEGVRHA